MGHRQGKETKFVVDQQGRSFDGTAAVRSVLAPM